VDAERRERDPARDEEKRRNKVDRASRRPGASLRPERAHAEPAVVGIVYQRLRTALIRQLRISSAVSDTDLGQAVSQRLGANGSDFVRTMQKAAAASRSVKVPAAEAFGIVTSLEAYEEQFGLKRRKS